ncbi:MAG: hypothetical protein GXY88_06775 [Tissierellia bacterium]|nr:hypothetical protein [Tissierellia bacterium]
MKIRGFFGDLKSANETVDKLKKAGFKNAYVDSNDHHIVDRDVKTDAPGSSGGESLADLVLKSGANTLGRNLSPLASANPMVSGMAGFDEVVDISYCLFVETEDKDSQKAKNIIKSMGGRLDT